MAKEDDKNKSQTPPDENQQGGSGGNQEGGGAGSGQPPQRQPSVAAIKKAANEQGLEVVNKDVLTQLLEEVQTLRKKTERTEEIVMATADKGRLNKYDEKNRKPIERVVRVTTYEHKGKLLKVVGWVMITDQVFKNSNGVYIENQVVRVILENDDKVDMPYIDFVKKTQHINATIKSRLVDESTGSLILTLIDPQGKEFSIDATFVN